MPGLGCGVLTQYVIVLMFHVKHGGFEMKKIASLIVCAVSIAGAQGAAGAGTKKICEGRFYSENIQLEITDYDSTLYNDTPCPISVRFKNQKVPIIGWWKFFDETTMDLVAYKNKVCHYCGPAFHSEEMDPLSYMTIGGFVDPCPPLLENPAPPPATPPREDQRDSSRVIPPGYLFDEASGEIVAPDSLPGEPVPSKIQPKPAPMYQSYPNYPSSVREVSPDSTELNLEIGCPEGLFK